MREWITEQVYIRNFNSIGSTPIVYDIKKGSSIFIGANGAGKTTLLSALLYVKYDSTVNGKPIDDVVNRVNGNNTLVLEKFTINDSSKPELHKKRFILYRGRKEKVFGICELFEGDINLAMLDTFEKNQEIENVLKDYGIIKKFSTGKTGEKELLEEYLIIDEKIFRSLVYVSGYNDDFADFGKADRRKYISNLFNINWFDDLVALKKTEKAIELKRFEKTKNLYDTLNTKKEVKLNEINLLTNQNLESKKSYDFDKQLIEDSITSLRKEISTILDNVELSTIIGNKNNLTFKIEELENKLVEYYDFKKDCSSKTDLLETKKETYNNNKTRIEKELSIVNESINNSSFNPNENIISKKEEKEKIKQSIKVSEELLSSISDKVASLSNNKSVIASKKKSVEDKKVELSNKLADINKLKSVQEEAILQFGNMVFDVSEIQDDVVSLKLKSQELSSTINMLEKDIEKSMKEMMFYIDNDICNTCKQKIEKSFKDSIIASEEDKINLYKKDIETTKSEIEKIKDNIKSKLDEISKINENKTKYDAIKSKLDEITNNIVFIENDITALENNTDIEQLVLQFENDKEDLKEIAVPKETDFGISVIKDNIKTLNSDLYKIESEINTFTEKEIEYNNLLSKKADLETEYSNNTYPTELEKELDDLKNKIESYDIETINESINSSKTQIQAIIEQLDSVEVVNHKIALEEAKMSTLSEQYFLSIKKTDHIEKEIEEIDKSLSEHSDKIDEMNKCITIKDNLISLFTSEDLKDSLFNHYIELMNFYSRNITNELGMNYRVVFQPDFEVVVDGYNISPSYKGMSGGEKKQINFIVLATFHKLLSMFGQFKTNIIFLDEYIDSKLDVINIENMVDTCIKYFKEQSMYMVIHNDRVYEKFDNIYYIKNDIFTNMYEIDKEDEEQWNNLLQNHAK